MALSEALRLSEEVGGTGGNTREMAKASHLSRHLFVDMPVPHRALNAGAGKVTAAARWGDRLRADLCDLVPCGAGLHLVDYAEVVRAWKKTAA